MLHVLEARHLNESALPVIDMSGLSSPKPLLRAAVGRKIRAACADKGFFYLTGHGVHGDLVASVLEETRRFFDLPLESKKSVDKSLSTAQRGYDAIGEHLLDGGAPSDLKEAFAIGVDLPEDPRVVAGRFNHGPNLWPEGQARFKSTMTAYRGAMQDVAARLFAGIALSLDLREDHFAAFTRDPAVTLRLLHYPPQPAHAAPGEKGASAHTDRNALTILLQDDIGGLQLHDRKFGWVHADPLDGAFIVNIGDMLARWTNDFYRSTVHRVVNASSRERYSVPFFFGGNPDQVIAALPGCYGPDNPPHYRPTTAEAHLREKHSG